MNKQNQCLLVIACLLLPVVLAELILLTCTVFPLVNMRAFFSLYGCMFVVLARHTWLECMSNDTVPIEMIINVTNALSLLVFYYLSPARQNVSRPI